MVTRFASWTLMVLLASLPSFAHGAEPAASKPTNFIVFIVDDLSWDDVGVYGNDKIRTPSIDRLASQGMIFEKAFLTCSSCSPSRTSILTGRYPQATGAENLHDPVPAGTTTFADVLRKGGYFTASYGKMHPKNLHANFDERNTDVSGQVWLDAFKRRPKDRPYFYWFASTDPHRPYKPGAIPDPHKPEDVIVPPHLPDTPKTRQDLADYYDETTRVDGVLGQLMAELDASPDADNTLVLFMSDNGRPFPRAKTTLYDDGIRTPFIVRWPKVVKAGTKTESLVSAVDIAPTFIQIAGLTPPSSFQGVSFLPILENPAATVRDFVFGERDWHDYEDHQRAVRDQQFKYIVTSYTDVPQWPPADAVSGPTFQEMLRLKKEGKLTPLQDRIFSTPRPAAELYDVASDPLESKNLAGNPDYAAEQDRLQRALWRHLAETGDVSTHPRKPDTFDRETGAKLADPPGKRRSAEH